MGSLWLPNVDEWIRDLGGLEVDTWRGWLTRSRASGGYDDILGICAHHDASSKTTTLAQASLSGFETQQYAPVGFSRLNRGDGKWMIGAAGATNTQGVGGPMACSRGIIPKDSGNRFVIAVEAMNTGLMVPIEKREPWSPEQQYSYIRGIAAIIVGLRQQGAYDAANRRYKQIVLDPLHWGDVHAHFEWTTRKIDPAGISRWANTSDPYHRWKMNEFRLSVAQQVNNIQGDDMSGNFVPLTPDRVMDTRLPGNTKLVGGHHYPLYFEGVPANASAVHINVTVDQTEGFGFVTVWPAGEPLPTASVVNYKPGDTECNAFNAKLGTNRSVGIWSLANTHMTVDLLGYYT